MIKQPALIPYKNCLLNYHFSPTLVHVHSTQNISDISELYMASYHNKLHSLKCWHYSVVYKKSCSQLMFYISFPYKKLQSPALTVPLLSHLTSAHPLNLIYILLIPWLLL